jgi:hypothetical protein
MSATAVQPVLPTRDWHLGLHHNEPPSLSVVDSGIDDPVNDTGLGPLRGDLQLSNESGCLLCICEGRGEF